MFVGKVTSVYFDIARDVQMAIDRELTTKDIQTAMTSGEGLKGRIFSFVQNRIQRKMIDQIIQWLERHDKAGGKISLVGAPYLLYFVMQKLQADGKSFEFDADSVVVTGGGWKVQGERWYASQGLQEASARRVGHPGDQLLRSLRNG